MAHLASKYSNLELSQQTFQRCFNAFLGWYDVAMSHSLKSMLNNVMYVDVEIYNVEQRQIDVFYYKVDLNNVRQRWNNVVIFNVDFKTFSNVEALLRIWPFE